MTYYAHPTAVIDEGCHIGDDVKIWHFCHLMSGCTIGKNCSLGQNVVVLPTAILGNRVKVQNNVSIYDGVECEDDVFIGPSAVFTNVSNPRSQVSRKHEYKKTIVKRGATIGANATILCGIEIGEYAFIGAGAVVTRDVLPFSLIMGNPARHKGWMSVKGFKLEFNREGRSTCPGSGDEYILDEGKVRLVSKA
jgi:UDP-2-acetamido-3-amino-2,3-dideoxy-glucuronate N-acetyltransferase